MRIPFNGARNPHKRRYPWKRFSELVDDDLIEMASRQRSILSRKLESDDMVAAKLQFQNSLSFLGKKFIAKLTIFIFDLVIIIVGNEP